MDLATFLLARLAEDEKVARAATPGPWRVSEPYETTSKVLADDSDRDVVSGPSPGPSHVASDHEGFGAVNVLNGEHIARHDPARVLAEVEAKREIVKMHMGNHECPSDIDCCGWITNGKCETLLLLVLPYADHPECHPSWLPPVREQAER